MKGIPDLAITPPIRLSRTNRVSLAEYILSHIEVRKKYTPRKPVGLALRLYLDTFIRCDEIQKL